MIATAATLRHPIAAPAAQAAPLPLHFWLAVLVIGGAFYLIDHQFDTSERETFASTIEEMEQMAEGGNFLRRLAFFAVAGCGGLLFLTSGIARFQPITPLGLLMAATIAWCGASWFWSIDPDITSRRFVVLLCCYLGALGIGTSLSPRELATLGVVVSISYLTVGLAAECYYGNFRPWMSDYRFAGTLHPNTQGLNLAMLCCGSFCLARRETSRWSIYWALLAVGLVAVILTKSRTSTGGILAALGVIWLLQASWRVRIATIGGGLGLAALALFLAVASGWDYEREAQQAVLLGRAEEAESLTGRLPIWFELVDQIGKRPWVGHGYDTFWTADNIEMVSERIEWSVKEGHNGYLDLTLAIGLIGTGLVVLTALAGLLQAAFAYDQSQEVAYGFAAGMLVFGLLNCCLESGMVMPQCPPFLTACALAQLAHVPASAWKRATEGGS